jgi:general secretion pathway protein J
MKTFTRIRSNGFTLLELLVSVSVFAILSVMAYGGLSNVIDNSRQTDIAMQRLQQVQLAMLKVSRDLSQLTVRSIRDEYGNSNNYIMNGDGDTIFVEFTRNGQRNPAEFKRSHLQRVAYRLDENTLTRLQWPQLDRTQEMEPYESVLLDQVESAEMRYLDSNNEWHSEWPPLNQDNQAGNNPTGLTAIEFKLELQDWGELMRIFRAAG